MENSTLLTNDGASLGRWLPGDVNSSMDGMPERSCGERSCNSVSVLRRLLSGIRAEELPVRIRLASLELREWSLWIGTGDGRGSWTGWARVCGRRLAGGSTPMYPPGGCACGGGGGGTR